MKMINLKNKKVIVIVSASCAVFFVLGASGYFFYQSTMDQINQQIAEKDQKISELESENDDLNDEMEDMESESVESNVQDDVVTTEVVAQQSQNTAKQNIQQPVQANEPSGMGGQRMPGAMNMEDDEEMCENRINDQIDRLQDKIDYYEDKIDDLEEDISDSDDDDDIGDWKDDISDYEEAIDELEEKIDDLEDEFDDC